MFILERRFTAIGGIASESEECFGWGRVYDDLERQAATTEGRLLVIRGSDHLNASSQKMASLTQC